MWKNFFLYTRSEQRGIVVLLILIFALLLVRFTMPYWSCYFVTTTTDDDFIAQVKSLNDELVAVNQHAAKDSLFFFNPNTVSEEELVLLGFSNYQLKSFVGYRKKLGNFKAKLDLLKVYGIDSVFYTRIEPYISIPVDKKNVERKTEKEIDWINFNKVDDEFWSQYVVSALIRNQIKQFVIDHYIRKSLPLYKVEEYSDAQLLEWLRANGSQRYVIKQKSKLLLELNNATEDDLKSLPGVGGKLASTTIKFRNALGGFVSKEQFSDVFGVSDELYKKLESSIKVDSTLVVKLDVRNKALALISKHPYINYEQAKDLKNLYRKNSEVNKDMILGLKSIKTYDWERIRPYLK